MNLLTTTQLPVTNPIMGNRYESDSVKVYSEVVPGQKEQEVQQQTRVDSNTFGESSVKEESVVSTSKADDIKREELKLQLGQIIDHNQKIQAAKSFGYGLLGINLDITI